MNVAEPLLDHRGRPILSCASCGVALGADDFVSLGMRIPDRGETHDDYCDAELIDRVDHAVCAQATRPAG